MFIGDINELIHLHSSKKIAVICFGEHDFSQKNFIVFDLSKTKNLSEAAINLFKYLRLADECDADIVLCEKLPEIGIGRAINDRLRRAETHN